MSKKNWFAEHKILTGVLIFIGLGIIGSAAGGNSPTTKVDTNNPSNAATKATSTPITKLASINEPSTDGKFEFTITGMECGKASVGNNPYLTKEAQGQYCLLNINVKNTGDQAQLFDSSMQYLYDSAEAKYSADGTASMYANPQGSTFLNQINPGNSVSGTIVFDVPKDKTPIKAELHDSIFSKGAQFKLN